MHRTGAAMHESSYKAGSGRRYQSGQGRPGRVPRILVTVVAVIALIVGGLALVRAVAPHAIAKLTAVSVRSLAIGAAALIVVAIILIVMARVASRRGNRVSVRGTAGGAIVAVVFAIMLTVAALLISNLFKDGIVKPSSPDKSPAQSAQNMQQSVEEAGIYCESGWSELSSQGYPGVTDVEICLKPRIAYVTFETNSLPTCTARLCDTKSPRCLTSKRTAPTPRETGGC